MKLVVYKNYLGRQILYRTLNPPKNRRPCNYSYHSEAPVKYGEMDLYTKSENGVYSINSPIPNGVGHCRLYQYDKEFMFSAKNGAWVFNRDAFLKSKRDGYPLTHTNKIVHFQTTADPTQAPTSALAKEIAELALEGTNADLHFINSGHLCILPTIPMSTRSVVTYGNGPRIMMEWSRRPHDEKTDEAHECEKLYRCILSKLQQYF